MAEVSFLHFPEEDHDSVVEDVVTLSFPYFAPVEDDIFNPDSSVNPILPESTRSGASDRKNQVNFVMDLFHQRVEQSDLMGNDSTFGVIEENGELGISCLDVELGLGLGLGLGLESELDVHTDVDYDDDYNCAGFLVSNCGDDFFIARKESSSSSSIGGLRVVGFDSDSEEDCGIDDLLGIGVHSEEEEEDFAVDNVNDDDRSIPLCWDSFQLEDHGEPNNDFEWEEVDGRVVDEREILSVVADDDDPGNVEEEEEDDEGSISVLPISGPEEDDVGDHGRGEGLGNLEWEVLLNVSNLERNPEMMENAGPYFGDHDDYIYTAEYEMMLGQFADGENTGLGRPPASKSVVEKLPSVVMTEQDVKNEKALCAVCKDQIGIGEEGKQLPCSHLYHGDCIFPWLGIRNTCPVCRHELPTDDPDYELRRIRRSARAL